MGKRSHEGETAEDQGRDAKRSKAIASDTLKKEIRHDAGTPDHRVGGRNIVASSAFTDRSLVEETSRTDESINVFWAKTFELTIAVLPSALRNIKINIEDGISQFLRRYSKAFGGSLWCFENVRILDDGKGHIINELPHIHYRVLVDGIVFAPVSGVALYGVVEEAFNSHLLLSVFGSFSASIHFDHLQDAGYQYDAANELWCDKDGNIAFLPKEEFNFICVKVHESDGIISIEGSNLCKRSAIR